MYESNHSAESDLRRRLFDVAGDLVVVATLDGRFTDWNAAFARTLGWSRNVLHGQPIAEWIHLGDRESTATELEKLRQGAAVVAFENRCRAEDGGYRRIAWTVTLDGERFYHLGRLVQQFSLVAPQASARRGLTEADLLPMRVVYEGDPRTGELRYREHWAELLGPDAGEAPASFRDWLARVHRQDRGAYQRDWAALLARKLPFHLEYRLMRTDKKVVRVQEVGHFHYDDAHEVVGVTGYVTPVVGWNYATELDRASACYRGLAECALALHSSRSLNDIHQIITDQARLIVGAHQAVTSMTLGATLAQAVNALSLSDKYEPWRAYSEVPDGTGIYALICETNRTLRLTQAELESHPRWRGFGRQRHAHPPMRGWLAAPLIGRDGTNLGLIQLSDKYSGEFDETDEMLLGQLAKMAAIAIENARLYRDIETARRTLEDKVRERTAELQTANARLEQEVAVRQQTEAQLRVAKEAADAASQAKSDFLANMSHEIRTPMNAIIGMTELVLDTPLTPVQRDYLTTVLGAADSLHAIINEILDFAKIEAGKLELNEREFDLREELGNACKSLGLRAATKGLELAWSVAPDVPNRLIGDAQRLRQILVNLIGNGIKFTPAGEVVVEVKREQTPGQAFRLRLHFLVRDTGIGIAADKHERIFVPFEQADSSTTREFGGTGLGLAISARLVTAMRGRLWVDSAPGQGSTFHFNAEFGAGTADDDERAVWSSLQGRAALVVDDNEKAREILATTLRQWGMQVEAVESAADAIEWLKTRRAAGQPLPLVLTDLHMPRCDGFEFIERLRRASRLRDADVVLLMSTARPGDSERGDDLHVAARILKPVKHSELLDAILPLMGVRPISRSASAVTGAERALPQTRPLRILVAEDGLANQKLAKGLLEKWGHTVAIAANGREALDRWSDGNFDLILMDVHMPILDGLDATRELRRLESQRGGHIPIIAMTARAKKEDGEACLAAGMDEFLIKPMRQADIARAIAATVDRQEPSEAATTTPAQEEPPATSGKGFVDWEAALADLGDDREFLVSLAGTALQESRDLLRTVPEEFAAGHWAEVRRLAHTFKSGARTFHCDELHEAADAVEEAAAAADGAATSVALPRLMDVAQRFVQTLEKLAGDAGGATDAPKGP